MRLAILSDIHANSEALAAVLDHALRRGVDALIHLGDLVGYNTRPRETLALLREHDIPGIHGNHDLMAIDRLPPDDCGLIGRRAIAWTREVLTDADCEYLTGLPDHLRLDHGVLCVHSALGDPVVRLVARDQFVEQAELLLRFDSGLRICLTGHTHVPEVVEVGPNGVVVRDAAPELSLDAAAFCFVNPGSVGLPRDADPRAAYAVLCPEEGRVWFHRVAYDTSRVARDNARRGIRLAP